MVKSPFYTKHDFSKGPCQCIYHRMKRNLEVKKAEKTEHNPNMKNLFDSYRHKIAEAVRQSKKKRKTIVQSPSLQMNDIFKERKTYNDKNKSLFTEEKTKRIAKLNTFNEEFDLILR